MHEALRAALAAEQLRSAVGEHLIDVHVALRARAGLPDDEREFLVVLTVEHLPGRALNGLGLGSIEQAELGVHCRRGPLDERQRIHHSERHALAGDAEKTPRALGLCAPQSIGRDLDRAEAVLLDAAAAHRGGNVTSSAGCPTAKGRTWRDVRTAAAGLWSAA